MAKYLHAAVPVTHPWTILRGKERLLEARKKLMKQVAGIDIRTRASLGEPAVLVQDMNCGEPIGKPRNAALPRFRDGLIIGSGRFFDARPFGKARHKSNKSRC